MKRNVMHILHKNLICLMSFPFKIIVLDFDRRISPTGRPLIVRSSRKGSYELISLSMCMYYSAHTEDSCTMEMTRDFRFHVPDMDREIYFENIISLTTKVCW